MLNDYFEYSIADHFLSAIVNNDYSGLEDSEEKQLKAFLDYVYSNTAIVNSAWDWEENDTDYTRCEVCNLYANCALVKLRFHNPDLINATN
jgi:hypothetical protein